MVRELPAILLLLLLIASSLLNHVPVPPFAWFGLLLATLFLAFLRGRREKQRNDFLSQLKSCRTELRNGGTALVDNLFLRYDSVLTTYHLNVGLLFTSITIPSRFRLYAGTNPPEALLYSLCTFISGWWSLPGGPLITINIARENLAGGKKTTVALLIDRILLEKTAQARIDKRFIEEIGNGRRSSSKMTLEERLPDTGPNRALAKKLREGRMAVGNKSIEMRIRGLYETPLPGGLLKARIEEVLAGFQETLRSKKRNPNPTSRS